MNKAILARRFSQSHILRASPRGPSAMEAWKNRPLSSNALEHGDIPLDIQTVQMARCKGNQTAADRISKAYVYQSGKMVPPAGFPRLRRSIPRAPALGRIAENCPPGSFLHAIPPQRVRTPPGKSLSIKKDGAPGGIRTHNHRIRSPVLYPLSHGGKEKANVL